jgi:integrase
VSKQANQGTGLVMAFTSVAPAEDYKLPNQDAAMSLRGFIETKFIPNHVTFKSATGQTHYRAILKHIVRPETVENLFAESPRSREPRLKTVPGWPYLDDVRLCDLTVEHVRQITLCAMARGYSAQTVKHIKNVLGTIISHAQKERIINGDNPAAEVKLPRLVHTTPRDLNIDEARAILRMLKFPEREIALISMSTGMGASEICALKWKHVNLTQSSLSIEGELVPPDGIMFRSQETGLDGLETAHYRPRVVVIGAALSRELERLRRQRSHPGPNDFVIATPRGDPIDPMSARTQRLRIVGRKLKMPWLSWRTLRRAHGALLSELSIQLTNDLVRISQSL